METDNDYQNRLPEHPEPLELTGHVDEPIASPHAAKRAPAASVARHHGGGYLGWAWLTAIAVAVLICSIYWFSDHEKGDRDNPAMARTSVKGKMSDGMLAVNYNKPGAKSKKAAAAQAKAMTPTASRDIVYLFPVDGDKITNVAVLDELAKKVSGSGAYVAVVAYTDESGRPEYNQRLSERRAEEVGDYLIAHGVPASHVKTQGLGPTHAYPTAAQDRRAEIHVSQTN